MFHRLVHVLVFVIILVLSKESVESSGLVNLRVESMVLSFSVFVEMQNELPQLHLDR